MMRLLVCYCNTRSLSLLRSRVTGYKGGYIQVQQTTRGIARVRQTECDGGSTNGR